jgi:hypothetical protein
MPLAIAVVVTLLVYWAAEGYAELLGEQIHAGRLPTREQVRAALAGLWPMVTASYVPLLALLVVDADREMMAMGAATPPPGCSRASPSPAAPRGPRRWRAPAAQARWSRCSPRPWCW